MSGPVPAVWAHGHKAGRLRAQCGWACPEKPSPRCFASRLGCKPGGCASRFVQRPYSAVWQSGLVYPRWTPVWDRHRRLLPGSWAPPVPPCGKLVQALFPQAWEQSTGPEAWRPPRLLRWTGLLYPQYPWVLQTSLLHRPRNGWSWLGPEARCGKS